MFTANRARFRPPGLGVSILLILVVFAGIALYAAHYLSLKSVSQQYHNAPGCSAGNTTINPSLPPCTVKSYSVVQAYTSVTTRTTSRSTHYDTHSMISIQAADGDQRTIEFPDISLWSSLHPGDPIKVQLWQGRSRLVYAQGRTAPTVNNPDYLAQEAGLVLVLLVLLGGGIVAYLLYGIISTARGGRVQPPVAAFYPIWTAQTANDPTPAMGLPSGAPVTNAVQGAAPATVAGAWRGSWGPPNGQARPFEAFLEVNSAGVIQGRFNEPGRVSEFTVAGEEEGSEFRFLKRNLRQGAAEGVEFRGQIAPDGRSLYGTWRRAGRVLGIPFKTAGNWSATRVADPNVAAPMQQ